MRSEISVNFIIKRVEKAPKSNFQKNNENVGRKLETFLTAVEGKINNTANIKEREYINTKANKQQIF